MVQPRVKLGSEMQPEPPALPGNLLVASSTVAFVEIAGASAQGLWGGGSVCRELLLLD